MDTKLHKTFLSKIKTVILKKEENMGIYINPSPSNFKECRKNPDYVDKSLLISELNSLVETDRKYVCVSRPRRFGKSMAGNMIAAYYGKGDSKELFGGLKIVEAPSFEQYLNKYHVLKFDLNGIYSKNSERPVDELIERVMDDFAESFPDIDFSKAKDIGDCIYRTFSRTQSPFVIIIDEYDVLVREQVSEKEFSKYLKLLNGLFKNADLSPAIALAYLTGILPIVRDKIQSKLNNFGEFTMLNARNLSEFAGFTVEEVKALCEKHSMDYVDCRRWYNGYKLNEMELYSPKSVIEAMANHEYGDYWTHTGSYEALRDYILMDFEGIKDDVIAMIAGAKVPVNVDRYMNTLTDFHNKDDVFTYLIHLGYLAYSKEEDQCYIPNKEIRSEWINSIEDSPDYRPIVDMVKASRKLLEDTWDFNAEAVATAVEKTHMKVTSNLTYNSEGCFQSAIRLAYFYADSHYTTVSELPAGKGYADVALIPFVKGKPAILIELKKNKTPDTAIDQIKAKKYPEALEAYKDNLLLVGISYDSSTKEHFCSIEKA